MIHFIFGNDDAQKKKCLKEHRSKNYPSVEFSSQDSMNFDRNAFEQSTRGNSLWGESSSGYILRDMLSNESDRSFFSSLLSVGQSLPIYFIESKIPSDEFLELFKDKDVKIFKKEAERPDFTLFGAVYARDKKSAWTAYIQKIQKEPIELVYAGVLSQFKNMYKLIGPHRDLGFKDLGFSAEGGYKSAQRGLQRYSKDEIKEIYHYLVMMPVTARADGGSLEIALEKFILERL